MTAIQNERNQLTSSRTETQNNFRMYIYTIKKEQHNNFILGQKKHSFIKLNKNADNKKKTKKKQQTTTTKTKNQKKQSAYTIIYYDF